MKTFLFPAVIFLLISCSASDSTRFSMEPGEGEHSYTKEHNKSQNDSFNLINEWIAKNYNNSKEVVDLKNKETGTLILKGLAACPLALTEIDVWYTLTIKTRDNITRFDFVTGQTTNGFYPPQNGMDELEQQYSLIASSITNYINTSDDF